MLDSDIEDNKFVMNTSMPKPRILYWSQHHAFGSAERYIFDLAANIGEHGFDVNLVCPAIPMMDGYRPLEKYGVKIHWVKPEIYERNSVLALSYWIQFFNKLRPSVVHFNDPCLVGGLAAWIAHVPNRVMMHHTAEMIRNYNFTGRVFEYLAFRSYTRFIFSNPLSQKSGIHHDGIPEDKCIVIPFGLSPDWFSPIDNVTINQTRLQLGLSDKDVIILNPARLAPQKRHDMLIEAAKLVISKSSSVVFLLAGEGELKEVIEHQISISGLSSRVRMLGHRTDIHSVITASDIVVLSSDFEGFPYVLMEAAARGIPAVSTEVGGIRNAILDGETGIIVPAGNPTILADALLILINDPQKRRQFGRVARQRAEILFSRDTLIKNTANFYHSLLDH
ncbi:MAG: hypothetical protein DPW16_11190 [Chloroflexi bacterium]|nr:hypothetical protein [Chloroflexota bacterium]